jgi:hypothetical protein
MDDLDRARDLAETLLAKPGPVGGGMSAGLPHGRVHDDALVPAAWLHDIGYAPDLVASGFHPLDGARYLRSEGFGDRVAGLVAHHSYAAVEADLRGLGAVLHEEFPREESLTADVLWLKGCCTRLSRGRARSVA